MSESDLSTEIPLKFHKWTGSGKSTVHTGIRASGQWTNCHAKTPAENVVSGQTDQPPEKPEEYQLVLSAMPGWPTPGVQRLRAALKRLKRAFGFRCVQCRPLPTNQNNDTQDLTVQDHNVLFLSVSFDAGGHVIKFRIRQQWENVSKWMEFHGIEVGGRVGLPGLSSGHPPINEMDA